jgi:hypothetical protein
VTRINQKYEGPPYRHRVFYSMGFTFALMVVMSFKTGQPAWVLLGTVGPTVLIAGRPRGKTLGASSPSVFPPEGR